MKKLFVLFLVVCAVPALVGCFGGSNDSPKNGNPVAAITAPEDGADSTMVQFPASVTDVDGIEATVADLTNGEIYTIDETDGLLDAFVANNGACQVSVSKKGMKKLVEGHEYEVYNIVVDTNVGEYNVPSFKYTR